MPKIVIMKTPMSKLFKKNHVKVDISGSNPFDSEDDSPSRKTKASPAPAINKHQVKPESPPLSNNEEEQRSNLFTSSSQSIFATGKSKYKNDFRDSGGLDNQSVQELENYAVYKAEETTERVYECRRIVENIREGASKTLDALHQQGDQITRTHQHAADIEHDLSRGEKLLGNLGGLFSKKWKPKKTRHIKGPSLTKDSSYKRKKNHMEQMERSALTSSPKGQSNVKSVLEEPNCALEKVEIEKAKQDDALSDISQLLEQLKDMAIDMGSEIQRQNTALDHMNDDVEEIGYRVKGANVRTQRLLGK